MKRKLNWRTSTLMVTVLCWCVAEAQAQGRRDPTAVPIEARLSGPASGGKALLVEPGAMTIIVREGRPYLAVGTRLYAPGQMLGQTRIERISETEVWLREGGVLRKLSQFSGIERRTVKSSPNSNDAKAPRND